MVTISKKPLLDQTTEKQVDELKKNLPQSLLIVGDEGLGEKDVALYLAGQGLVDIIEPIDSKDLIDHAKGIIRVKQIRTLVASASIKSRSRRVYIIYGAEKMNLAAQNAFLKLLEEPSSATHFILISRSYNALLPTIVSRTQKLYLHHLDAADVRRVLRKYNIKDPKTLAQIMYLSAGRIDAVTRYISDPDTLARDGRILKDAQTFLLGTRFEKIKIINEYGADRSQALTIIEYAKIMLMNSLDKNPSIDIVDSLAKLHNTYDRLRANGNVKLQLMVFVV